MSMLVLQKIDVTLGANPVLDGISLQVAKGEFISILGPSGVGKSTIFRLLPGALAQENGSIAYYKAPLDQRRSEFAFMPQHDALMPWRYILDIVTLALEVQGIRRKDARAQVLPLLAEFGLEGFEQHYPVQLSGGMRQRAALLRTIVHNRAMLLLNEPFGALDALTRRQMQSWFENRWLAARWTTLLVTHDVREAVALSDRIYVLSPRPAKVVAEYKVPIPLPRLARPTCDQAHALKAQILETLIHYIGEKP